MHSLAVLKYRGPLLVVSHPLRFVRAVFQFADQGFVVADRDLKLERSAPNKQGQRRGMLRRAGGVLDGSHFS